jgi:hypothetical protein
VRARIHKLPDTLKERLRQRPRAIGQLLELGMLYTQQPETALTLADRVVYENLTVVALRTLIRDAKRPMPRLSNRDEQHNRRANATSVLDVTSRLEGAPLIDSIEGKHAGHAVAGGIYTHKQDQPLPVQSPRSSMHLSDQPPQDASTDESINLAELFRETVAALTAIASHAEELPFGEHTMSLLDEAEQTLAAIRLTLVRHISPNSAS